MIIDHRAYTVKHGKMGEYLKLFESEGLEIQLRHLTLVGFFSTTVGNIHEIIHMWSYDDMADMERRRAARDADPDWTEFKKKTAGLLLKQETKILAPFGWSPIK